MPEIDANPEPPMMQRRHYEWIAATLAHLRPAPTGYSGVRLRARDR